MERNSKWGGKTLLGGTGYDIPFAKGVPLSTITPGAILYLNESGSPVPFYVAKHDYESGLNGAGRTLAVRKDCYGTKQFGANGLTNAYENNTLDSWLNNTYLKLLPESVQNIISTTAFKYTPGDGDNVVNTLRRAVFQLSATELGQNPGQANYEGSELPIANMLKIAKYNGAATTQWTRTPYKRNTNYAYALTASGEANAYNSGKEYGARPTVTLPATTAVIANADGTYTLAA